MAIKNIVVSDLSGTEVDEEDAAMVVVTEHPNLSGPVEIDVTKAETEKFQTGKLELVTLKVYDGSSQPRTVVMDAKQFNTLFKGNADDVLKSARKPEVKATGARRTGSGPKAIKIDYTDMSNIALIHRGKVTEDEARLVRENLDQANKNRAREGQPPVGDDPKDKARYGL